MKVKRRQPIIEASVLANRVPDVVEKLVNVISRQSNAGFIAYKRNSVYMKVNGQPYVSSLCVYNGDTVSFNFIVNGNSAELDSVFFYDGKIELPDGIENMVSTIYLDTSKNILSAVAELVDIFNNKGEDPAEDNYE